jgi:hypothetical protein
MKKLHAKLLFKKAPQKNVGEIDTLTHMSANVFPQTGLRIESVDKNREVAKLQ